MKKKLQNKDFLPRRFKSHKKCLWLIPFVESVKDLIPTKKLTGLKGYKVSPKKFAAQYGACLQDYDGTFIINMRLYRYDEVTKKHVTMYQGHLLETFAHELAHMVIWEHNAEHMRYTGKILQRFAKVLKKQKITDTYKHRMKY